MTSVSRVARIVGIVAGLSAAAFSVSGVASASAESTVVVPTFSVTKAWPANAAVAARLPQGPQHFSLMMSIGKGRDRSVVAESGYIDFTGGAEGGCSYRVSLRETLGGEIIATTRSVRDPQAAAYEKVLSGKNFGALDTWVAIGYPWSDIGNGPLYVPGTGFGFDAQPVGPNQGAGLCRFDDVANYTTLMPGTNRLRIVPGRMDTIIKKASRYNAALLVNELKLPNQAQATSAVTLIDELAVPSFSPVSTGMAWHLSKSHGMVTFSVEPVGHLAPEGHLAAVVTFTPTNAQSVPPVHGASPEAQEIAGLGGKKNFFKNLFTLDGKPLDITSPANDAALTGAHKAKSNS